MAGSQAKQQVIEQLNLHDYDEVVALGDTASDAPLLSVADTAILVDPTDETLETYRKDRIQVDEIVSE